jgi:hypothetical protein
MQAGLERCRLRTEGVNAMTKKVFSRVMWVGRATVFLVGLAVTLALVFGVAVTALAGTGVGATFNLGKTNTVNALSRLEGSTLNSMLKIDQNGSGTALNLEVQNPTSKPPMLVNSSTKVTNLNSDQLDGQDSTAFLPRTMYTINGPRTTGLCGAFSCSTAVFCDAGDVIISGGYHDVFQGTYVRSTGPVGAHQGWQVEWVNTGPGQDDVGATAYCADFGTPH